MASITKKVINGKPYYYVVETKRVNGKPRIVSQIYLGKIDDIVRKVTEPPKPSSVKTREFGITAALLGIIEKLGLVKLIDDAVIKREQGASVGQYMLVAALNRCSAPTSKTKIGEWYEETILPRILSVEPKYLTSQRFWDNMSLITDENLTEIKAKLAKQVADTYNIDLSVLLYDATNFFTFIDTNNDCNLPQRGHNKQKRNDLRQISFSLIVSRDGAIPLLYDVYQGNDNDSVEFDRFVRSLISDFKDTFTDCKDITIVCDKGNNSKDNLDLIMKSQFHLVSSLSPVHCKELLDIPLSEYRNCKHERLEGEKYYRTTKKVLNQDDITPINLNYNFDQSAFDRLKENLLGKTILYTDRKDWETEDIILAYRDQYEIEHAFRQMKDPSWVSWKPNFHWTDHKIKIHAFYCYLALLLSSLLKLELEKLGLKYSKSMALERLSKIEEVTIEYSSSRRQQFPAVVVLADMDPKQKTLFKKLNLEKYTL